MNDQDRRLRGHVGSTGPGPGAGGDRETDRAAIVLARIAIVATIVVGQLWGLTIALNAYFEEQMSTVWWLVGFQLASFGLALVVWWLAPNDR